MISPLYFSTSGLATPFTKLIPKLKVLLFIEVERPGSREVPKLVSIFRLFVPPNMVVPAPVAGSALNLNNSYPYVGAVPSVDIASLRSCQYFRTPVFAS